jgi:uncharacterized protein (TIGR03118 family)
MLSHGLDAMTYKTASLTALCLFAFAASSTLRAENAYQVRNLVSDIPDLADHTDPTLKGAWGISASPASPFWISDAGSGVSTLYTTNGTPVPLVVTIPPSKAGGTAGTPTGTVFNGTSGFALAAGKPSLFLFATLDGTISGWNSGVNAGKAIVMVDNSSAGAEYTGLALASNNGSTYLYAANFHSGRIDVFDSNFAPVFNFAGFHDPLVPNTYAPFNVQTLNGNLYVAFAQQNSGHNFSMSGPGLGYVDVFEPNGLLIQRVAANGPLNAPWGLAIAPSGFGDYAGDLLVGNFGDGTINAFNATTGAFIAQLHDTLGTPIVIPNLWALRAGNGGNGGEPAAVYFTAGIPGPDNGNHGLLGRLHAGPQVSASSIVNGADARGGIAPNTWVAIMGANLSETTRASDSGDIVNGALPTELDGVSVTVSGAHAFLSYISPTQINALIPTTTAVGPAMVQVNSGGIVSTTVAVQVVALAPALVLGADGKNVVAMHADGTAVSAASMAKPGETITLFGTGFGPTNPATPNGQVITTALPVTNQPTFMIGGGTAKVISAALTGAGQYTFQVIVPTNSITGEAPIWATVNGVNSPVSMIPVL